ncbi:Ribonuclease h domain [Thalictrum thalictroides]|uniref:Ribonuclease h domain n=1 Tax=Thalictrum thalictroides TaxID=46969 RepID=A0A7J6VT08_THATH|nr:Ribonuclease h domain [Thalictrum thalictroides]
MNQAVDLATLPIPTMRGERPAITIPVSYVEKGLEACKFALVGRLDLKNVKIEDIKAEIAREWGLEATVRVSPLGKDYVMVRFSNEDDFKTVWYGGPWYLSK